MHVVLHLTKFYDWEPIPRDVTVTPQDIASGKVKPGRDGGMMARVVKVPAGGTTPLTCSINEATLIAKIVQEKADPKRAGRTFSRKQAVAHLIQEDILPSQAEWEWVASIEVHDDGPDAALMASTLASHAQTPHGRRAGMIIPLEHVDEHHRVYAEPADSAAHAAHLRQHFGVGRTVA